ncbi:MAG: NUDIX hydrolase [Nitrospira sp.]|uniref:Nudix hydrolase domain-containing protein n=1 Tax=Nitrospira defluvii TaxID=330214 RepID=A0ABM8S6G1_9BACT|nr:NUDIX hydrolase [Nitrospira defluvii]MCS6328322.1 NUDIX hydrolase [Nitrospira sp.]CAE6791344.1 Nudix hydrolase domain-containing protein [Nitrospira defluvii]
MESSLIRPTPAVIGVVVREGKVLLVRRNNPPDAGKWGFPGGKIELGETLRVAAAREVKEETGLLVSPNQVITALDVLDRDAQGSLRFHYVLIAVLCDWISGVVEPADDVSDAAWFEIATIGSGERPLSASVPTVAAMAYTLCGGQ